MRHTPPFLTSSGQIMSGSISEIGYLRLGGIDQFVMIRGENLANPILIILHGGPGLSDTPFLRKFNSSLEKSYTIVYWDQRGVGRSFKKGIPISSMTVEQFISDLDELVDLVCKRTGKNKVAIFGHSWGSALGVLYSVRFPKKVLVYVGCGQYGDWAASELASYTYTVAEAKRQNNKRAFKELSALGTPPYAATCLLKERTWLQRLEGQLKPLAFWRMIRIILYGKESSIVDLVNITRGFQFSLKSMWDEVSKINLLKLAPYLQMPVFFLLGKNDHWVPPETSEEYFNILTAPSKKLIWFENSGHEPFVDEPEKFNETMIKLVHPVVASI
jgi:pimeloyl-ACP methyl ester carboxylesterase